MALSAEQQPLVAPPAWSAAATEQELDEEQAWLVRARYGEEAAYRWLLARYRERAVRLAAHILRNAEEAEDVAQEAFIKAFGRLSGFRGTSRFYTWLYQIVVRLCLDRRRLARWHSEVPDSALDTELLSSLSATPQVDTRLLVEALLDRLSPPMRAALVLRELEELEYDEIAQVLKIPVGTVRSRLHAARGQFKALYAAAMREADHA